MTAAVPALAIHARRPDRRTLVRAVCVREWREAASNKLLVGMTLLPPLVILAAGIVAVAAAAVNPPSERLLPCSSLAAKEKRDVGSADPFGARPHIRHHG